MIRVVNRRTHRQDETVYIGRGSMWGNRFVIGQDGSRARVIWKYAYDLWLRLKAGNITLQQLRDLRDETLGCYCKPHACHGDVLVVASTWAWSVDQIDPAVMPPWVSQFKPEEEE